MATSHAARSRWHLLERDLSTDHVVAPRMLQVGFVLLVGVELLLRLPSDNDLALRSWPVLALSVLVLATAVTWWTPAPLRRPGAHPYVLVVLVDLAAIGVTRLDPDGSAAAILVVLPALWWGQHYGQRGAWGAGLACVLLVSLPGVLYVGLDGASLTRAVLPPTVAVLAGLGIAEAVSRAAAQRDEADRRGRELAEALATIKHQRRTGDAILDTVDVGLLLLDAEGRYLGCNKRHEHFLDLAFPEGHAGVAGQLGLVRRADGVTVMTTEEMPTYRAARGEELDDIRIWVGAGETQRALSVSARSIRDEQGRYAGSAMAYTDVTDFMDALEVKDAFVASVSHELRTPLTSITGYLEVLLEREDLPTQAVHQLGVAQRNADRLQRLVGDLLTTAVADASPTSLERALVDLGAVVREQVEAAQPAATARGIAVEGGTPGQVLLHADGQRLRQVVDNLLSNALKHTPSGGRVAVGLTTSGNGVEIYVADSGPGIDPAERELVFGRFFRTRASRDQVVPGVGLGLAITRDIVLAHGGRIHLDDAPGGGTLARVLLPREQGAVGSGA